MSEAFKSEAYRQLDQPKHRLNSVEMMRNSEQRRNGLLARAKSRTGTALRVGALGLALFGVGNSIHAASAHEANSSSGPKIENTNTQSTQTESQQNIIKQYAQNVETGSSAWTYTIPAAEMASGHIMSGNELGFDTHYDASTGSITLDISGMSSTIDKANTVAVFCADKPEITIGQQGAGLETCRGFAVTFDKDGHAVLSKDSNPVAYYGIAQRNANGTIKVDSQHKPVFNTTWIEIIDKSGDPIGIAGIEGPGYLAPIADVTPANPAPIIDKSTESPDTDNSVRPGTSTHSSAGNPGTASTAVTPPTSDTDASVRPGTSTHSSADAPHATGTAEAPAAVPGVSSKADTAETTTNATTTETITNTSTTNNIYNVEIGSDNTSSSTSATTTEALPAIPATPEKHSDNDSWLAILAALGIGGIGGYLLGRKRRPGETEPVNNAEIINQLNQIRARLEQITLADGTHPNSQTVNALALALFINSFNTDDHSTHTTSGDTIITPSPPTGPTEGPRPGEVPPPTTTTVGGPNLSGGQPLFGGGTNDSFKSGNNSANAESGTVHNSGNNSSDNSSKAEASGNNLTQTQHFYTGYAQPQKTAEELEGEIESVRVKREAEKKFSYEETFIAAFNKYDNGKLIGNDFDEYVKANRHQYLHLSSEEKMRKLKEDYDKSHAIPTTPKTPEGDPLGDEAKADKNEKPDAINFNFVVNQYTNNQDFRTFIDTNKTFNLDNHSVTINDITTLINQNNVRNEQLLIAIFESFQKEKETKDQPKPPVPPQPPVPPVSKPIPEVDPNDYPSEAGARAYRDQLRAAQNKNHDKYTHTESAIGKNLELIKDISEVLYQKAFTMSPSETDAIIAHLPATTSITLERYANKSDRQDGQEVYSFNAITQRWISGLRPRLERDLDIPTNLAMASRIKNQAMKHFQREWNGMTTDQRRAALALLTSQDGMTTIATAINAARPTENSTTT
jgi:hypothetical protein